MTFTAFWKGGRAVSSRTGSRGRRAPERVQLLAARHHALNVYAALAVAYLLVPIAIIALFSFNDTQSRFNFAWHGFTLEHWTGAFSIPPLTSAMATSLQLAALSTIIATTVGTMMALALVRYQFRGRRLSNLLIVIPMATPEVVIGAALLSLFVFHGIALGFSTLLIAHVMFSISFVVVVVRSRLIGFDRSLEEAAMDLGASPLTTFRTVTLPLILPAILAAGLLAFALSVDDFVISNFNAGQTETFPLYIYGAARVDYDLKASRQIDAYERLGYGHLPVCIAKTHLSISSDPTLKGAPTGWTMPVREVRASVGAGFIYPLCGDMRTMPGLARHPAAERIDIDEHGQIVGLS
jgi:spermidine/putrescine transport system permease protein